MNVAMRLAWLAAFLTASPAAARQYELIGTFAPGLVGEASIKEVEVTLGDDAAAAMRQHEVKAAVRANGSLPAAPTRADYAALPFDRMFPLVMRDQAARWGLAGPRPVKLLITLYEFGTADAGRAMLGGTRDLMAGLVEVQDPATRRNLGRFTIRVVNRHAGWSGMLIRGGGIRERLTAEFADETMQALMGRKSVKSKIWTGSME